MEFKPINEWILVEEEEPVTKTLSGIYIPKVVSSKQLIKKCKVLAISDELPAILAEEKRTLSFKVGDTVVHHSQIGIKIDESSEKDRRFFLKYDTVMALYNGDEKNDQS